jgi:polysaccharide pyruvyl transferase WcaK-like protein
MGVRGRLGGVHPDVAFSLPVPEAGPERPGHVVLGVMAFEGGPGDPRRGPGMVETYVGHMARLITRLADQGRTVTLVIGDLGDRPLTGRIVGAVRRAHPDLPPGRVEVSDAADLAATMREMARAEVVVASRFHNVVCALKTTRPTVSLGYAEKNAHVLSDFGIGRFSQPMESFDVDTVLDQIEEVQRLHPTVEALMKETLDRYQDDLEVQLAEFSAEVVDAAARRG